MLKAVIVDDELGARHSLKSLVEEYCPKVEVVALAEDVITGMEAVKKFKPDIVFLDVEMPNYNGFKLIDLLDNIDFKIIFTTAYERYAFEAFKAEAIDYLLKPISIDDLIIAVDKVAKIHTSLSNPEIVEARIKSSTDKITFPSTEGMIFLTLSEIVYIEAKKSSTTIYLEDGSSILSSRSLSEYDDFLPQEDFCQIHRSLIINLERIDKYIRGRKSHVIMENKAILYIGKSFKDTFVKSLQQLLK